MDHHFRILQQRSQAVAIRAGDEIHCAMSARDGQCLEWAGDEVIERQKENLHASENHTYVRHQFAIFISVGDQYRKNVNRKQKAPEKQRAFLASPQSSNFIKRGEGAIAMGDDVGCGKIIAEEKIFETEGSNKNQATGGDSRLPRTFNEQRMARDDRGNSAC